MGAGVLLETWLRPYPAIELNETADRGGPLKKLAGWQ
jgi:hypothetical protein